MSACGAKGGSSGPPLRVAGVALAGPRCHLKPTSIAMCMQSFEIVGAPRAAPLGPVFVALPTYRKGWAAAFTPAFTSGMAASVALVIARLDPVLDKLIDFIAHSPGEARLAAIGTVASLTAAVLYCTRRPKPRVTVQSIAAGEAEAGSRKRLAAAGYEVAADTPIQIIHCEPGTFSFAANGFSQCFAEVAGHGPCRIVDFAPGQALQMHAHDRNVRFVIGGGYIKVFKWERGGALSAPSSEGWLGPGATLSVPLGTPHAIFAHPEMGVSFHEVAGAGDLTSRFETRASKFLTVKARAATKGGGLVRGRRVLCPDSALRFVPCDQFGAFGGRVIAVTGCNRGLGLGLCQHLAAAGAVVVATCRDPSVADALRTALRASERSVVLPCDVADAASVAALADAVRAQFPAGLDALINNAGIATPMHPVDPIVESSLENLSTLFRVNVAGAVSVTQALLPLLRQRERAPPGTAGAPGAAGAGRACRKLVVNLSSQLGSIENCLGAQGRRGGVACYRISRAANNMATRTFAGELAGEGFVFLALSPGHVATDMGSAGGRTPPLTVEQSVAGMAAVMAAATHETNGKFLDFDGTELPW